MPLLLFCKESSLGIVIAFLHSLVGTRFAYSQLLIHPIKNSTVTGIEPGDTGVFIWTVIQPSCNGILATKFFPSKEPMKYWVAEPLLGPTGIDINDQHPNGFSIVL